ncbi:Efflux pump atB [Fusarium oxysporum f. sp. albedinis]|nr:hypothetical protein HZ326_29883 [Fusarium oxysporum f. sp. albedinis]KAJ0135048.1 Serine/threonine protein kinase [Fusarium oxysporum f. sp. albedinis]KAJ0135150.1 Efflux pump atB [Fusarium oxysporum f. sp. albedinis]
MDESCFIWHRYCVLGILSLRFISLWTPSRDAGLSGYISDSQSPPTSMVSYEQRYALHRGYWWFVTACGASGVHGRQFKGLDSYFTGYQPRLYGPLHYTTRI